MKSLFTVLFLTGSMSFAAQDVTGTLNCVHFDNYGLSVGKFSLNLSEKLGMTTEKDSVEVSWSQSECEDSTNVTMNAKEFKALINGKEKKISAEVKHETPESNMTLQVMCSYTK